LGADLHGTEIFERLLLLLHTVRGCAGWRANTERVFTIGEADSSPLHEAIQRIPLQLVERVGGVPYVLKLDQR